MNKKIVLSIAVIFSLVLCVGVLKNEVRADNINKKICWGIKRSNNHEQPDLGKENRELVKDKAAHAKDTVEKEAKKVAKKLK